MLLMRPQRNDLHNSALFRMLRDNQGYDLLLKAFLSFWRLKRWSVLAGFITVFLTYWFVRGKVTFADP